MCFVLFSKYMTSGGGGGGGRGEYITGVVDRSSRQMLRS